MAYFINWTFIDNSEFLAIPFYKPWMDPAFTQHNFYWLVLSELLSAVHVSKKRFLVGHFNYN